MATGTTPRTGIRTVRNHAVPAFLYGTAWKEERTEGLTALALATGFRGIDTANQRKHYFEAGVGRALAAAWKAGTITRKDVFLQTKFTYAAGQDQRVPFDPRAPLAEQVRASFESSLEHLGTDYLDSYVLHGPWSHSGLAREDLEVWRAMEELADSGRVKLLGVSNTNLAQLRALHERAHVRPAFVQNRCYARTGWDRDVRIFCAEHDCVYQGFSLLTANARELGRAPILAISQRKGRSVPELVFRFALDLGMLPLTGTSNEVHMRKDLACVEFELTAEERDAIEQVAR